MIDKAIAPTAQPIPAIITGSIKDVRRFSEWSISRSRISAARNVDKPSVPDISPAESSGATNAGRPLRFDSALPNATPREISNVWDLQKSFNGKNEIVFVVFAYAVATGKPLSMREPSERRNRASE